MDEHKEKEANKFQESSAGRREQEAEAEAEDNTEESMGDGEGYKAAVGSYEEESTVQLKEVVSSEEEVDSSLLAHPCLLLRLLLRACAGCLGLHGYCTDPKPAAADAGAEASPANTSPSQEGGEGGEKANYFYMQEVVTRVWALGRRPRPPDRPREGSGGNGGVHH